MTTRPLLQSPLVVGICGGSCSGKSTLVAALCERMEVPVARLCFDSYYRPLDHMSKAERDLQNFDHPGSLDHELFLADLDSLIARKTVQEPIYDFANHARRAETTEVCPSDLVLVDGILLFTWPEIVSRLDFSVFVDADEEIRLRRRLARDVVERGRSEASVRNQFVETVAPMHELFVQPSSAQAELRVRGDDDIGALSARLAADLSRLLSE